MHVFARDTPGARHTMDEEAEPAKCGKGENVARNSYGGTPLQAIERFSKTGAEGGRDAYLPPIEHPAEEQHRKEI